MNREERTLPVPEGIDGLRVDAALSKMLGLSRTITADLCVEGAVLVNGDTVSKSDRLSAGQWVEVTLPEPAAPLVPK